MKTNPFQQQDYTQQINQFIGREHDDTNYDCADLAVDVARDIFGREIVLPSIRPRPKGQMTQGAALHKALGELAKKIAAACAGDLVLMRNKGHQQASHIGTYFWIDHQPHVLHTSVALGYASLHKIRDLKNFGLEVEGFYRWLD